jgi:hypothetical protein
VTDGAAAGGAHSKRAARLSTWSAVLMSLAALATSWASYQASLWSGEQLAHSASSAAYRAKSTRLATHAGQLRLIDIGIFGHWMTAVTSGDSTLVRFIAARFREEFVPAFDQWMASRPMTSPDAAPSPFALPSYRLADDVMADGLERAADREAAASQHANRISDSYVLDAVLMAMVLFFAGADSGSVTRLRIGMLLIASSTWAVGVIRLLMAPRA